MTSVWIYTPKNIDEGGQFRGSGRIMTLLQENLKGKVNFTTETKLIPKDASLLVVAYNPFQPPFLEKRIAEKQYLLIYDVIPLKYPKHFPAGAWGKINLWRNNRALLNFDGFITISESAKNDIVEYLNINEDKIHVVYPAAANIFFKPKAKTSKSHRIAQNKVSAQQFVLYVGDVNWNKNLVNLARAIKIANISCLFVGKPFDALIQKVEEPKDKKNLLNFRFPGGNYNHPWQKEFKAFLAEVENDKRFIFKGYIEDKQLINLYKQSVCNILVSRGEGFGLSYLEAATQGIPSILADIPVFREIASDCALFVNPEKPEEIADKIKRLFSDKKKYHQLGIKARERVSKKFSPNLFAKDLLSILK